MNPKILLVLTLLLFSQQAFGEILCRESSTTCDQPGEVEVLRMFNTTNSHAESPNESPNYPILICCQETEATINLTSDFGADTGSNLFASLSSLTNAHVEFPINNYTDPLNHLYFNSDDPGTTYNCGVYGADPGVGTCVYALSGTTNAHVSTCTDPQGYTNHVYCSSSPLPGWCGDGTVNSPGEECDDGDIDPDDTYSDVDPDDDDGSCVIDSARPTFSCKTNICGDGYWDAASEECESFDPATRTCDWGPDCNPLTCLCDVVPPCADSADFLKATVSTKKGGSPSGVFYAGETLDVVIVVENFSCNQITDDVTVTITNLDTDATYDHSPPSSQEFGLGSNSLTQPVLIDNLGGVGSYEVRVSVPNQPGEIIVQNNSASAFFTVVERPQSVPVSETNLFLLPLVALIVLSIILFSSRK